MKIFKEFLSGRSVLLMAFVSLLYAVGCLTSELPDGRFIPLPGLALVKYTAFTFLLLLVAGMTLSGLYTWMAVENSRCMAFRDLLPVSLLTIPFFRIYLLHGVFGLPQESTVLLTPTVSVFAVLFLAGFNIAQRLMGVILPGIRGTRLKRFITNDRAVAAALFTISFVFFALLIAKDDRLDQVVGDEPHYLVIMESLKIYHTADVTRLLNENPPLGDGVRIMGQPHITEMSRPGTAYSVHHIGLPILMIVPHTVLGFKGVMLFFAAVTALIIANLYLLNRCLVSSRRLCAGVALLIGFSAPFSSYFRMIYPDLVASLFLLYAFRVLLLASGPRLISVVLASTALAYLPWLHVKYLFVVAPVAGCYLIKAGIEYLRDRDGFSGRVLTRQLIPFLFLAVSAISLMAFFQHAFGNWKPDAQYGPGEGVALKFLMRGVLGQLLDRDHGVIPIAPFYLMAVPCLWFVWKKNRPLFLFSIAVVIPYIVGTGGHHMWWGGPCAPGRFILPALVLFSPFITAALEATRSRFIRSVWLFMILISALSSIAGILNPAALTRHANVIYSFVEGLQAYPAFPCFYWDKNDPEQLSSYYTTIVIAVLVTALIILFLLNARSNSGTHSLVTGMRECFYIFGLLILMGGLSWLNSEFMMRDPNRYFEQNIRLSRVSYPVSRFTEPINKAGRDPAIVNESVSPSVTFSADLDRWHRAERSDVPDAPDVFMFGPYIKMYPVNNRVEFYYEANTQSEKGSPGFIEVTARDGVEILSKSDVDVTADRMVLRPIVNETKPRVEFRAAITNAGSIHISKIVYSATIGQPAVSSTGNDQPDGRQGL